MWFLVVGEEGEEKDEEEEERARPRRETWSRRPETAPITRPRSGGKSVPSGVCTSPEGEGGGSRCQVCLNGRSVGALGLVKVSQSECGLHPHSPSPANQKAVRAPCFRARWGGAGRCSSLQKKNPLDWLRTAADFCAVTSLRRFSAALPLVRNRQASSTSSRFFFPPRLDLRLDLRLGLRTV